MKFSTRSIQVLVFFILVLHVVGNAQTSAPVSTPRGSSVTAWITPELSNSQRISGDAAFSGGTRTLLYYFAGEPSSSGRFNCHGYAWNMHEGGPVRWIGWYSYSEDDVYRTDGSYIRVCNEVFPAKVSFVGGDHSAITTL